MLLDVVKCPYCGQKECFFVSEGAIFSRKVKGEQGLSSLVITVVENLCT